MKTLRLFLLFGFVLNFSGLFSQTQFTGKPRYQIVTTRGGNPLGTITVEMFPNIAPKHVRNFDSLVGIQFYDTCAFHRCMPNFMIQGGDPNSRSGPVNTWGIGQPGQTTVPAEFTAAKHLRGRLSAARKPNPQINSATSQFFICVATYPSLDGQYSVYGQVVAGMNWADTIAVTPKTAPPPSTYSNMPLQKIEMFITYIGSNDSVPDKPALISPANYSLAVDTAPNMQFKWTAVNGAVVYEFQLSRDSTFQSDTIAFTQTGNLILTKNNFKGNTFYFWRVRSNNGGHFSAWSDVWRYHTEGETTGIAQQTAETTAVNFFPNPGNSVFQFENLKQGSIIEVIDYRGRVVLEQTIKTPTHQLDLSKQDKGVYVVRISDKNGLVSKHKLILQ